MTNATDLTPSRLDLARATRHEPASAASSRNRWPASGHAVTLVTHCRIVL